VKLTKSKLKQLIREELTKDEEKKKDKLEKDLKKLKHK